jgi:hypothetical protein
VVHAKAADKKKAAIAAKMTALQAQVGCFLLALQSACTASPAIRSPLLLPLIWSYGCAQILGDFKKVTGFGKKAGYVPPPKIPSM